MDKSVASLGEATVLSTLDENSGYWQFEIYKSDRDKTAFSLLHEQYRFIRMPFVLSNNSSTLQHRMNTILSAVKWQFDIVDLDDQYGHPPFYSLHSQVCVKTDHEKKSLFWTHQQIMETFSFVASSSSITTFFWWCRFS